MFVCPIDPRISAVKVSEPFFSGHLTSIREQGSYNLESTNKDMFTQKPYITFESLDEEVLETLAIRRIVSESGPMKVTTSIPAKSPYRAALPRYLSSLEARKHTE
jgi:hypothetical protein